MSHKLWCHVITDMHLVVSTFKFICRLRTVMRAGSVVASPWTHAIQIEPKGSPYVQAYYYAKPCLLPFVNTL